MEGFFTQKEMQSVSRPDGKSYSCVACGLYKKVNSPRMKPFGNFKKKIMLIGEAPGKEEDKTGKPFQGKTGRLLQRTFKSLGIDIFEDCIIVNACHCHPTDDDGDNRAPTNYEIESCRKTTLSYISQYKPKIIILLGNAAVYSVLGHRYKKDFGGITKWRGWSIPDQDLSTWLCPTFHPSYVERSFGNSTTSEVETVWREDLKQFLETLKTPFPKHVEPDIEIIKELKVLKSLTSGTVAFDFETTGKKPHAFGHRIVSCSVADTPNHVYAFLIPQSKQERQPLVDLLANPKVGKVAQNMKFEDTWSIVRLRQRVEHWEWDTMIASHILDNRYGVTGLKFQVYVQFGIIDYSSELDPYLKDSGGVNNANAFNQIDKLLAMPGGIDKLLKYNAYDSIYEYRLAEIQRRLIYENCLPF